MSASENMAARLLRELHGILPVGATRLPVVVLVLGLVQTPLRHVLQAPRNSDRVRRRSRATQCHETFRIRETAASTARAPGRGQRSQKATCTSGDLAAWARRALRLDLYATQSRQSIFDLRRRQRSHGSRGRRRPMGGRHVVALRASRRPGRGERTASTRSTRSSSPGRRGE